MKSKTTKEKLMELADFDAHSRCFPGHGTVKWNQWLKAEDRICGPVYRGVWLAMGRHIRDQLKEEIGDDSTRQYRL